MVCFCGEGGWQCFFCFVFLEGAPLLLVHLFWVPSDEVSIGSDYSAIVVGGLSIVFSLEVLPGNVEA